MIDTERTVALRSSLAADGYLLHIAEEGTRVRVTISATPQACLVPRDLMRGILEQAIGRARRHHRSDLPAGHDPVMSRVAPVTVPVLPAAGYCSTVTLSREDHHGPQDQPPVPRRPRRQPAPPPAAAAGPRRLRRGPDHRG